MRPGPAIPFPAIVMAAAALLCTVPAVADEPASMDEVAGALTYADIADLADSAEQVLRAEIGKLIPLDAKRAPGVKPGWTRYYVEAKTSALIFGSGVAGEKLRYLVDLPLDENGKPPALRRKEVLLFARDGATRPGEIQLVAPDAQLTWDADTEQRLRVILGELHGEDAPPRVTGVREAIHVPGSLAGEGETQLFLSTEDGAAAAITVTRQGAGAPAEWSVSFSEIATGGGTPPARNTLEWYRLACFLPPQLSPASSLSGGAAARQQAAADYRQILDDLGPCERTRK